MTFDWISSELLALADAGLQRSIRTATPLPHGRCVVDGAECVNLASNDYLGLAGDPRVVAAALDAVARYGAGARASSLVSGRTPLHDELEQALARFEGVDSSVLFPSGFAANVGVIGSLVGSGDVVFTDRLNHASLIDGCRLSGARLRVFSHSDVVGGLPSVGNSSDGSSAERVSYHLDQLRRELDKASDARRRLIVTDSLFSMDGDAAPLRELFDLAEQSSSMLLIDEAHATGVFGATGRGWCEETGLDRRPCVRIGTLSKAIGAQGGFVVGNAELCQWIRNTARSYMFSTALTPGACGAALESLKLIDSEPWRRTQVRQMARDMRSLLKDAGWRVTGEPDCPIIPIIVGEPQAAVVLSQSLQREGFLIPAIRPPTVPRGTSRLRLSLTAEHQTDDIHRCVEAMRLARQSLSLVD